jgi:hypothetical protein
MPYGVSLSMAWLVLGMAIAPRPSRQCETALSRSLCSALEARRVKEATSTSLHPSSADVTE